MANSRREGWQHWPVMALGVLVAAIFVAVLVTFQVNETEHAILLRFGKPVQDQGAAKQYKPGLHLKWPFVDSVWTADRRLQCYELDRGNIEQIQTADNYQIVVSNYVLWRVGDPAKYRNAVNTRDQAEDRLDDVVRNGRKSVLGRHRLTELINLDPDRIRLKEIENEVLNAIAPVAREAYGIEIADVGFKHIGFPEQVTRSVFVRMRSERASKSEKYRSEGERDAKKIRAKADQEADEILAKAEAQAQTIRAEGDSQAAEHYRAFAANPELAQFLRKLESLRKTLDDRTTMVLDTDTPPFDLLNRDALDLPKPPGNPAEHATETP